MWTRKRPDDDMAFHEALGSFKLNDTRASGSTDTDVNDETVTPKSCSPFSSEFLVGKRDVIRTTGLLRCRQAALKFSTSWSSVSDLSESITVDLASSRASSLTSPEPSLPREEACFWPEESARRVDELVLLITPLTVDILSS
jgi:hypothetical protein